MDHLSKSRNQNYEVDPRDSVLNQLGATRMNDSKDYGFDWINNDNYDWDSSRREEFKMSKRETPKGWNAYGATLLDDYGKPIRDNVGRTVRENLGASRRVDLGTTGETRLEVTPDATGSENYGGRNREEYYHPDSPGPSGSITDEPLPPVTERVLYPSTESYDYALDDGFETADGKQRRWTSVAADRSLMRQWHDMFGRIRTKWSSNSGFDSLQGVSKISRDQSFSDKEGSYHKRPRLQRLAFIGGAVCIVLLVAVLVPVMLLTGYEDKETKEVFLKYEYEATVINRNYSEDMANSSSEAFTTVENEFCDQLDRNAENKTNEEFTYQGCAVTEIRNGSLVIRYTLVILSVTTPTAEQVSNVVGVTINGDQQDIGDFTVTFTVTISAAVVISEDNNPVRKKVQFNAECIVSEHDRCVTNFSECIGNVCSCPVDRYHGNSTDECTLIDCGEVQSIGNGTITKNGSRYGSVLYIMCEHGYKLSDNATVTCSSHGSWGRLPSCEPVTCQEFIKPNYSYVDANTTGRVFEERIKITCSDGYVLDSNTSSVICQADKSWSMSPICVPITCEKFPKPQNSMISPLKAQYEFNENISVECRKGYQLVGNQTLGCLANGTWIDIPTCEPIDCDPLPFPDFAVIPQSQRQYVYNENVTIACKDGYKLDRNESVSCQTNSTWTDLPSCTPIECESFIQPVNSEETELNTTRYRYSDFVTVTCQSGYTLIGNHNLSCNADGFWPAVYCAEINCTDNFINPSNSIVIGWNESTSTYEIGCKDGYNIVGNSSVTCLNDATWSTSPTCEAKDCGHPSEIPNAAPIDINITTFNSKFSVKCNEGFNSADLLTVTCQSDGTWSKIPTCKLVSCGNVTVPEFATITVKEGNTYGKNVTFECIEGYELEGNSKIVCQHNGSWTSYPVCQIKDCGQISEIADGIVFNETGTTFGSMVHIKCNEGFDIVGNDVVTCLSTGKWNVFPTCKETDCGSYSPPPHTNVGPNDTLSCDIGYELTNNDVLVCIAGNWSNVDGCMPVQCSLFPDIKNANTSKTEGHTYVFGDTVEVLCYNGFEIPGSSETKCGANKTWENVPHCDRIICQEFSVPNHSVIGGQNTKNRVFEDEIFVNCSDGYSLIGNGRAICGANKEWLNIPRCDPILCEKLHIPNTRNQLDNVQYKYNEDVTVVCVSGYILEGNDTLNCLDNGSWTDIPTCKPVSCGQLDIANASLDPNETEFRYNDFVSVTCNSGYTLAGNDTLECLDNGSWTDIPTCKPVSCDQLDIPYASLDPNETQFRYNDFVSVTCNSGYTLAGNDTLECLDNGSWTDIPTCKPVSCDQLDIPNASLDPNQTQFRYNDFVSVTCNSGYTLAGNDTLNCLNNGSWTDKPTCKPVSCEQLDIPNASLYPDQTQFRYNDFVSVACKSGYTLAGNDTLECLHNGSWTDIPTCKPVSCGQLDIPYASLDPNETQFRYNDFVSVTCNSGYTLAGNDTLECLDNGSWTDIPTCKPVSCGQLDIQYASLDPNETQFSYNDFVSVTCNSGYTLAGNDTLECLNNGSWTDIPTCKPVSCGQLDIPNASLDPNETQFSYNDFVSVTCNSGYTLAGNDTLECLNNGSWTDIPTCKQVSCGKLDIPNASLDPNQTQFRYNDFVSVTCNSGFTLVGNDTLECLYNGSWTAAPTCDPVLCGQLDIPNASLDPNKTQFTFIETVRVMCNSGYTLDGNENLNCFENGSWINIPSCSLVFCDLLRIQNADVTPKKTNYTFNETVTVECVEGFQLEGNKVISCNENGTWINSTMCMPVRCEQPSIQNAGFKPNKTEYTYNENVTVHCDSGYTLQGDDIVSCAANRTWGNVSICIPVECKLFTLPENAFFSTKPERYFYNENVTLECRDGYELEGGSTIKCQANKSWTELPICKPIACEPLHLPDYVETNTNFTVLNYEDKISVSCKSGFILLGLNNFSCNANGTWPDIICVEVNCSTDNILIPENSGIIDINETVPSFEINCTEGYQIVGNSSVTCLDGSWSQIPTCEIVNCGDYIPIGNYYTASSDAVTTYNSSLNITCIAGLEFSNDSTRVITCEANGQWKGNPVCNITGKVSFTKDDYSLIEGNDESIICDVTDYPSWQSVLVAKLDIMNSSSYTPIVRIFHENESVVNETLDDNYITETSLKSDGVSVTVAFKESKCDDKGVYICAAIVGDPIDPIEMKQTRTNVSFSCSEGCREYVPGAGIPFDLVQSNTTTPIDTSVPVKCIDGLDFTSNSTTYLTCGADGKWIGQPECRIPGNVLFTQTAYSFEVADTAMIICEVTNYSSWQTVVVAKQVNLTDGQVSPIARVTNENDSFPFVNVFDGSYKVNATTREDGVAVSVLLNPSACANEEIYMCAAVVGDEEKPFDSVFTETRVTIITESQSPDIRIPPMVYLGRDAHVDCTGSIGKGPTGERKGYLLMMTNFGVNGSIALYNGSDSPSIEGCYYRDAITQLIPTESSGSYLWAKCIIRHFNGTDLESEQRNISVQDFFVAFEKMSYVFNIGEKSSFVCEVENIPEFDRIEIRSGGGIVTALNTSDMAVEAADSRIIILANETFIMNSSANIVVMFDLTVCSDTPEDMVGDVEYTCVVLSGSETSEGKTIVTFQRQPSVPELILSHQIIEGQDTWADRPFKCEGQVGDPVGTIEVESDFDGDFGRFLAPLGPTDISFGVIVSSDTMKTQCGYNITLKFGLKNISRDHMHLKNLRCVTRPSDNIVNGRVMYSERKVVKVVPGDYCEGVTTPTYKPHPFFCNSAVACNENNVGVNVCGMDECADTQDATTYKCSSCDSVADSCRAKGVQCFQTSQTAYKGETITFTCNTQDFGSVAVVSVNNFTTIDVDNENESVEVMIMENVIVTVSQYYISLGFTNVSCDQEGEYVINLNNEADVTLSLRVISEPEDPVISMPMVITANQETNINCSGKVGRDVEGKNKTTIQIKFNSQDTDSFEVDAVTIVTVDDDCEIFEMVSFSILPDVRWNNSQVRCVTLQDSSVVTSSPSQQLILQVPGLFCQPLTAKSELGGSVTFACALKDVSVISNVVISKDGTELINADNETVPFEGNYDDVTLTIPSNIELNVNFPNVTCEQEGVYLISVNQGLSSEQTLRVVSPAKEQSLNTTSVGRINELFEIRCSGYVGRDEEGKAASKLHFEMKTREEPDFFVTSDNVTREPAVENNCNYFETIHMTFFPDISWNNTWVRCVARNETDIITGSNTETIQLNSPNTYFENTGLTGVVGESLILTCVVDHMEGLSDIHISKGSERKTIASYSSVLNSEGVIVEESRINGSAGVLKINLTLQCGDEGMYYCKPSGSGPTTEAVTMIHLQRKPGIPELKMSREIIENKYTLGDRLFYCGGDLGDPAGRIEIQSNFNGSFQPFLSSENRNNSIGWIVNNVTNSTSCKNFIRLGFAFHNITMELQSKTLRCVIHPAKNMSVSSEDVFDEKHIYIIPDDFCVGKSGYIPHPYFCHLRVECDISGGKIKGVPEGCKEYDCYNENSCVDCSTIGGCNITGPTTTTITTPSPDSKYLDSDDLLNGENAEDAQVICNLNNIEIDFSNLTGNPVSVEADNSLGLIFESSRDDLSESNTFITSGGVKVSLDANSIILRFEPLQCKHVGIYTFRYATLETTSQIDIIANVSTPTISKEPENFYEMQQVSLKCTGDVGRPKGDLVIQVKTQNGENWQEVPGVTRTEEETSNCTTLVTLNYLFYVDGSHNWNQYRCQSEGDKGESLNSSIIVVEVIDSVIYFTEAGVTAEIGSDFELKCILEGNLATNHVVISRKTVNKEEKICTMTTLDTVNCSPATISGNVTFSESNRVITINIEAAECGDEGTYFCGSVNDTSFQTSINVSLTRSPAWKPMLSLPNRMVVDFREPSLNISCNADVGYPPGDLRLEYRRDNSTSYSTFDIGTAGTPVENKEGCSVNKSISYTSYTYTESWNNTSVRCAVYSRMNTSEEPVIVSDIQTVNLINNECPSSGILFLKHPLNCHFYIFCNSGSPTIVDCKNDCPNIVSNTDFPHCSGNCTELC